MAVPRNRAPNFNITALPAAGSAGSPLNGTKTHPMTPATRDLLRYLLEGPKPSQQFNPGVRNRWERGCYIEYVGLASPYPTHRGKPIPHVQITMAGRAALRPPNFDELSPPEKWVVDKELGILDWDGKEES